MDALGADLPPALADSMRSLWVSAVEHGERIFEERRGALEDQLAGESSRADAAEQRYTETHAALQRSTDDYAVEKQEHVHTREQLSQARAAVAAGETRVADLEQQLALAREQAARDQTAHQAALERQTAEFRDTLDSRDRSYQAEIDKATTRLQSAQDHMLQNIDAARETQKRVEGQLTKLQQRYDGLHSEAGDLRVKLAERTRELQLRRDHERTLAADAQRFQDESQHLSLELAGARGQLSAAASQLAAAEERARSSEARLDRALAPQHEAGNAGAPDETAA